MAQSIEGRFTLRPNACLVIVDGGGLDRGMGDQLRGAPDEGQELVVIQTPHPVRTRRLKPADKAAGRAEATNTFWTVSASAYATVSHATRTRCGHGTRALLLSVGRREAGASALIWCQTERTSTWSALSA